MHTTQLLDPPLVQGPPKARTATRRNAQPPEAWPPTFVEIVDETLPLIDFVAVAGPPVAFVAIPYLLFVLMLTGPFLLLVTLAVVALVAAVLVALAGAILATPLLLAWRLCTDAEQPGRGHRRTFTSSVHVRQVMPDRAPRRVVVVEMAGQFAEIGGGGHGERPDLANHTSQEE
jgi:hypothetical protein